MNAALVPELICSNLVASLEFYCDILGFKILYDRPEERFAYVSLNDAELMLEQPLSQDRLWPKAELVQPFGRGINFEIRVDQLDAIYANVITAQLPLFLALESKSYRRKSDVVHVHQFAVEDPDGYIIRLSQRYAAL